MRRDEQRKRCILTIICKKATGKLEIQHSCCNEECTYIGLTCQEISIKFPAPIKHVCGLGRNIEDCTAALKWPEGNLVPAGSAKAFRIGRFHGYFPLLERNYQQTGCP